MSTNRKPLSATPIVYVQMVAGRLYSAHDVDAFEAAKARGFDVSSYKPYVLLDSAADPAGRAEPVATEPMFLIVAGGDNISTEIVPQSKLDEAYLLTQWGSLDPADADQHREALEHFHDADEWQYIDPLRGGKDRVATIFHLNLEGDWVSVYRLPDAAPILTSAQPAGWKLVPMEMTGAMRLAGRRAPDAIEMIWSAVLAAAPEASHGSL